MIYSRIRIKMCGMTRADDIEHAISIGVDALGFIFYDKSSRYLSIADAKRLVQGLPAFVDAVAVFVNPEVSFVERVMSELPIQYLQFHGEESPAFCEQFDRPYLKAVPAVSADAITNAIVHYQRATAIVLDTPSTTSRGGSGVPFDWRIIPQKIAKPIILAGGLDAINIREALATSSPYAVDVCSGIERSAGVKDHDKMDQFVRNVSER